MLFRSAFKRNYRDKSRVSQSRYFTSPNSGSPFLTIGGSISEPVLSVKKSNNVDGAVLQARNQFSLSDTGYLGNLDFYKASTIPSSYDRIGGIRNELYDNISIGNVVTISDSIGYDGVYTVRNKLGGTNILELATATFSSTSSTNATITVTTGNPEWTDWETDRKSTRLNSSHITRSRMPSSA